jgi:UDP-MurNAc hydroxylase
MLGLPRGIGHTCIDGNVLTCQMHGWQFDLATGRCLTSPDHEIRAQRAN